MSNLVKISELASFAKARGFRVHEYIILDGTKDGGRGAKIFAPDHEGPDAVQHYDSVYSCADFVVSDRPSGSYGYNSAFYGPWHDGYCQIADISRLLSHPGMSGHQF